MGFARIGSEQSSGIQVPLLQSGCPIPVATGLHLSASLQAFTHFGPYIIGVLPRACCCRLPSGRGRRSAAIGLATVHHRPCNAGGLVGQRHGGELGGFAGDKPEQPGRALALLCAADHRGCGQHQKPPQRLVALLGDAAGPVLFRLFRSAAASARPRRQNPGRKRRPSDRARAAPAPSRRSARCRGCRRAAGSAHCRDARPSARRPGSSGAHQAPRAARPAATASGTPGPAARPRRVPGSPLSGKPLWAGHAELGRLTADGIDQRRALPDEPVAHRRQRGAGLLVRGLDGTNDIDGRLIASQIACASRLSDLPRRT